MNGHRLFVHCGRAANTACFRRRSNGGSVDRLHRAAASQRGDGLDLDQERLLHETVDDQQRVGRIDAVRKQVGKFAQPIGHEFRDVLRMDEIGRELDHMAKLAPCDFSAASMLAKTCRHCASKSSAPTVLPLPSVATWPAMNRNSDALTRVICEY